MATFSRFEDIEAWKLARIISNDIFKLVSSSVFDSDKRLRSQMNGSSGSVMDNTSLTAGRLLKGMREEAMQNLNSIFGYQRAHHQN